ncbi:MAG: aminoacyl-tRNA hydrolase, partial [bacterium]|nr:aminoacyl-tRNA hydrolase [bacterium]
MGLFYRRELPQTELPYTVSFGQQQTKLIVGLGNIGKKYDMTRHNIGFACVDALVASENGEWHGNKSLKSFISDLRIGQSRVIVCKPQTFMNLSGDAVQAVQSYFKITSNDTAVVHDELDMVFGQIRSRKGGSAAGHNGIKSLIQYIGENFLRVRIGVKNEFAGQVDS